MNVQTQLRRIYADESGQDLVEYALIIGLMALSAVVAMKNLASSVVTTFGAVGNTLSSSL